MKKNRPAYQLNVVCTEQERVALQNIIFQETTTIGIRIQRMERAVLPREIRKVNTSVGTVTVKVCQLPDGTERCYPEYDEVAALSDQTGRSYLHIYNTIYNETNKV